MSASSGAAAGQELAQSAAPRINPFTLSTWGITLTLLFWMAIGAAITMVFDDGREFVKAHERIVGATLVGLALVGLAIDLRRWAGRATASAKAGLVIFLSVPLVLVALGAVFFFPPSVQVLVIRTVFLLSACLLPASMYYLFIATKKYSLVNDFLANLGRLGLPTAPAFAAPWPGGQTDQRRQQQARTYLQRFQAIYGPLPEEYIDQVMDGAGFADGTGRGPVQLRIAPITELFSTQHALPVIQATVLIALGWLVTLPPWQGTFLRDVEGTIAKAHPALVKPSPTPSPRTIQQGQNRSQSQQAAQAQNPQGQLPPGASPEPSATADQLQGEPSQQSQGQTDQEAATAADTGTEDWAKRWLAAITPLETPVFFGFIGAYFFSIQMLFRRFMRRDLRGGAYVSVSQRILLAVIGAWVLVAATKIVRPSVSNNQLLVIGFCVGVFPRVAWQAVRALTAKLLGGGLGQKFKLPSFETPLPISDLDGLTVWHEARLEEEDIENVPNMATADLVDLMLNTRIPPDRIIDWVDQSILYTHIGPEDSENGKKTRRDGLRSNGIYTASALIEACQDAEARAVLEKTFGETGVGSIRALIEAIQTNSNLKLILTWRGLAPSRDGWGGTNPGMTPT